MLFCQHKTLVVIQGKLVFDNADLEGIYIYNLNQSQSTITQMNGYFSLNSSLNDTLLVSSLQFEKTKYVVQQTDIDRKKLFIPLKIQNTTLNEVEINQFKKINSKSLGLIPKNQKVYTPAERKLKTAGELHWYSPLLIPLGGMDIDGFLNAINGRTKQLKKEVEVEKKEFALKKLEDYFEDSFYTKELKIPADKVNGFKFYLVDDLTFMQALDNKNKNLTKFLVVEIAEEYKKINPE
jgi:hypothetical protein